jgi:nitroreductase
MLNDLVKRNRSYRRFHENESISITTLHALVELARCIPSAANRQPLKYKLVVDSADRATIFPHLNWAGYLTDWPGPAEGERPSAYILILGDTSISANFFCDHGIAAQTVLLGAVEIGLGGCIIASMERPAIAEALNIPTQYEILLTLALGKPAETVVIESLPPNGSIKYWRDKSAVHHVPKRNLDDLILD